MKTELDDYDHYLKPYIERYIDQLIWAASLPWFIRIFLAKYIAGMPDEFSATNFLCRNWNHELSIKMLKYYKLATGYDWHVSQGVICLYFSDKKDKLI